MFKRGANPWEPAMSLMIYGVLTLLAALVFVVMRYGDDTAGKPGPKPGPKTAKPRRRSPQSKAGAVRHRQF